VFAWDFRPGRDRRKAVLRSPILMKLYLGLLESSASDQTRIFGEIDGKLIDLNLAYAAYLTQAQTDMASAHREFEERREEFSLTAIEEIRSNATGASFLLCDLDHNGWEIASLRG
jgi:hypothetical protein